MLRCSCSSRPCPSAATENRVLLLLLLDDGHDLGRDPRREVRPQVGEEDSDRAGCSSLLVSQKPTSGWDSKPWLAGSKAGMSHERDRRDPIHDRRVLGLSVCLYGCSLLVLFSEFSKSNPILAIHFFQRERNTTRRKHKNRVARDSGSTRSSSFVCKFL